MNRRHFMTVFCLGAIAATSAFAASYEESVIAQLQAQGYKNILVERTLLGRVKISASLKGGRREIILNPRTGEVLRDLWIGADGGVAVPRIASNGGAGGDDNGGSGGDDNGGDDNGGSAGSGGGSGGTGGGSGGDEGEDRGDESEDSSDDGEDGNED